MEKINYLLKMNRQIQQTEKGEKLLLHCCCAPCSTSVINQLKGHFNLTVYFYNPNIDTEQEYLKRKNEVIKYLNQTHFADFLDCDYAPNDYLRVIEGHESDIEGGERCFLCYKLRLSKTAEIAKKLGFKWFCSTLSVSPHKNAYLLNTLGEEIQKQYGVSFLYNDFKKNNGYLNSIKISNEYNLYRQNYCGCKFAKSHLKSE